MRRWWRHMRLMRAYAFMRDTASEHRAMGHDVEFTAVNETHLSLKCLTCRCRARRGLEASL